MIYVALLAQCLLSLGSVDFLEVVTDNFSVVFAVCCDLERSLLCIWTTFYQVITESTFLTFMLIQRPLVVFLPTTWAEKGWSVD